MKKNIGKTDAIVRMVIGIVVLFLGVVFKSWWGLVGIVLILTSILGWCPLYRIVGISTCKTKK